MMRTSGTADYMVAQCDACGMLNVIPREYVVTTCECADCSARQLRPMGYAILHKKPMDSITVKVDVEREQLDRLIDDVAAVSESMDCIIKKMEQIKEG